MENQLQETGKNIPAVAPAQAEDALTSNILLPKILLMQGLSEFVVQLLAKPGDIVKSLGVVPLGDADKPIQVIPLTYKNYWELFEMVEGEKEWRGKIPRVAANEDDPWEYMEDGKPMKRVQSIEAYVLLPMDIEYELEAQKKYEKTGEMPDLDKTILPGVITFRSSSFKAGKAFTNHWLKLQRFPKIPAHHWTIELGCHSDKEGKKTWHVWDTGKTAELKKDFWGVADEWANTVRTTNLKVDESADEHERSSSEQEDIGDTSSQF